MTTLPAHMAERIELAQHTTLKLGGPARYFATCSTLEELRLCLQWAGAGGRRVQVLGGGSNVVFADGGFDGLVLKVGLRGVHFAGEQAIVAAGEVWDVFVAQSVERGLAGVECLSGIPGRVGATPIQNVGAYGQEVKDTVASVRALDRQTLEEVEFTNEECRFAYRDSRFKSAERDRYIVTEVRYVLRGDGRPQLRYAELQNNMRGMDLPQSGPAALRAVRNAVLEVRGGKSMLVDASDPNSCSAGSFFVNPIVSVEHFQKLQAQWHGMPSFTEANGIKIPAAWLVENAGFAKGQRYGGVGISQKHALALINCGGSTEQLLELAAHIQRAVEERFAIHLEREPIVVV